MRGAGAVARHQSAMEPPTPAGIAAALVRARTTEHLAAVCWATKVDNKASVTFTKGFYERMGTVVGCDIAEAFQAGVDAFTQKYNIGDPDA